MRLTVKHIALDSEDDYLDYFPAYGDTGVEIIDIAVRSERQCGKGRQLIVKLLQEIKGAKFVFAKTRITNYVAQRFYERLGFRMVGVLRNFYGDEDAIVYGLDI